MTNNLHPPLSPLQGVRIVDLTTVLLGPYASQLLGDYGADVIKVESPLGDTTRHIGPAREPGMAATFIGANRNKRSVVLDLKQPEGRAALLELVARADVFMHNIRPQKMEALGLGAKVLMGGHPRLIYVGIHGFGQGGPYAGKPAYDDIIQGLCGLASLNEMQNDVPKYLPSSVADKTCGIYTAMAVSMALVARATTGLGSFVEIPMFESMVNYTLAEHFYGRHFDPPIGEAGYSRLLTPWRRPYKTADDYVCIVPYTDAHWRSFFTEVSLPHLALDSRFQGVSARTQNIDALYALLEQHVARRTTADWLLTCERIDIPAAPLNRLKDLERDPHLCATEFFQEVKDPSMGTLRMPGGPVKFNGKVATSAVPPRLGQHTREVLAEAGLSTAAIDALIASKAAGQADMAARQPGRTSAPEPI